MLRIELNIGLSIGEHGAHTSNVGVGTVLRDTYEAFCCDTAMAHRIGYSECGEPTVCITLQADIKPSTVAARVHHLSTLLQQDCIAYRVDGDTGHLVGPNTAPYGGAFSERHWLACP